MFKSDIFMSRFGISEVNPGLEVCGKDTVEE